MKYSIFILLCILTSFFSFAQNANQFYRKADSLYARKDFKNSAIAYNEGIRLQGAATGFNRYLSAASSWILANTPDSAFYLLNRLAQNDKLTQSDYKNIESAKELEAYTQTNAGSNYLLLFKNKLMPTHIPRKNLFMEEKMEWDY